MERKKTHLGTHRLVSWLSRIFVWSLLFGVLYLLRSFFLLILLTFVFAYLQERAVKRLERRIKPRIVRVVIVAILFLALIAGAFAYIIPPFAEQARVFANSYGQHLRTIDVQMEKLGENYPSSLTLLGDRWKGINASSWTLENSPSALLVQQILGLGESETGGQNIKQSLEVLKNLGAGILGTVSAFLLSLLFSFLIVLDLPRLTVQVKGLEKTKVKFIFREVAGSIYSFGDMLGRALEAQFFVAVINTLMTLLGLYFLGLTGKIAFLSLVVFLCSFIPIAGVFISSVPICLVALQTSGIGLMLLAILMITAVHLVETYVLNPQIYGQRLHMNAVLVLIVLTVAGKLFGIWGLVLGLPVSRYFFGEAIRHRPGERPEETVA